MLSNEEKEKVISFVLQYEQPNGGFSFSKTTPPTREDTYYALRILKRLDFKYSNKKTFAYLEIMLLDVHHSCRHFYQLLFLLDFFTLTGHQETMKNILDLPSNLQTENINELYYFTLIRDIPSSKIEFELTNQFLLPKTPFSLNFIPEVSRRLLLLKKMNEEFEERKYIQWIQKSQSSDGGFGFLPYTTTFLENTCYALRGLQTLNATPLNLEKCEQFILQCKTGNGGFSRKSSALGTLQATYHAICSLEIIYQMKEGLENRRLTNIT
ncbi:hypothetical protein CEE45_15300 [Candidatus Heimdallarchaeota archaeon B3_Heim]|nr:MAG: hypothetical protein CEE45_15300 [Candidatus Heimdallarchaeota archaeon B3_Heim]